MRRKHQRNILVAAILTTVGDRCDWGREGLARGASPCLIVGQLYRMGGWGIFICMCIPPMSGLMVAMLMLA